jgi:hypothetical protein
MQYRYEGAYRFHVLNTFGVGVKRKDLLNTAIKFYISTYVVTWDPCASYGFETKTGRKLESNQVDSVPGVKKSACLKFPLTCIGASEVKFFFHIIKRGGKSRLRFPIKLLDFSIDLILPAALMTWGRLSL